MRSIQYFILSFLVSLICFDTVSAQTQIHGMVADSSTMQALPNVNIRSKQTGYIAVTDIRGHFSIDAFDTDTITFTLVGYYPKKVDVKSIREAGLIFLTEEQKMLKEIEISGDILLPYLKKIPPESPWKNPTQGKNFIETPGFQGIQTFGPGYVLRGPISRFSKDEKERKKLKMTQKENYKSKDYVAMVNAPEVKERIMKDYALSEDEYYKLLAVFNEKNKDIIYQLEKNELISLLLIFYGESTEKK